MRWRERFEQRFVVLHRVSLPAPLQYEAYLQSTDASNFDEAQLLGYAGDCFEPTSVCLAQLQRGRVASVAAALQARIAPHVAGEHEAFRAQAEADAARPLTLRPPLLASLERTTGGSWGAIQ